MNPLDPTLMDQTGSDPAGAVSEEGLMVSEPGDPTLDNHVMESTDTSTPNMEADSPQDLPKSPEKSKNTNEMKNAPSNPTIERLEKRMAELNVILNYNEELKIDRLEYKINDSYYYLWSSESNKAFRLLSTFSKRIRRINKGLRSN